MQRTAVVGAGPAGLLFVLIGKIRIGDAWPVVLFDKRDVYARTHRLRMAPEPYRDVQTSLADPRFDELMQFLEEHRFSPEVNLLEERLFDLLAKLGVKKTVREITRLDQVDEEIVVAADSVHSTIREIVRGDVRSATHVHERVARLRAYGEDLPRRIGALDQYRLSKVLGSVVDYRLNKNGFAEIDLFLTPEEHGVIHRFGATPKAPLPLTASMLDAAKIPFFHAIVAHLERGHSVARRTIVLQSTFALEHSVMPRVSFEVGNKRVFLVGDAGISLPFFRGMACLVSCADALARAIASDELDDFDSEVREIVERELKVVRARAALVHILREVVRISALLPFPIQTWWLSAARDPEPDELSAGGWFNVAVAAGAVAILALGLMSPWLAGLAWPVELGGGVAYRWTLALEPGPHRYLRRIWEVQLASILVGTVAVVAAGRAPFVSLFAFWLLGGAFVMGIYAFERLVARRLRAAQLEEG